nr:MFS transporter [Burkholderia anthina]
MSDLKGDISIGNTYNPDTTRRRTLWAACGAHAVHDGLTDVIYVLLPIWQAQFAINFAQVGLLRGSYSGVMAGFQLLASRAARRWGRERMLVGGTALAGIAYLIAGQAGGLAALMIALVLAELAAEGKREQAFALFYTGTIGAGALSPILFGRLGDVAGVPAALLALASVLLLTLPLSWYVQKGLDA